MEVNEELDPSVENEIIPDATQPDAMNLDGANDPEPPTANGVPEAPATFEARIPAKKDATLREFLGNMDEYAPIVCIPTRQVELSLADIAYRFPMQSRTTT
jgi:transcription initiation factor TFIID subunit 10